MLNTSFFQGGAAKVAQTLHQNLNESREFFSYFAYGRGKQTEGGKAFKFGLNFEIYLSAFLLRFLGIEGGGAYFSTKRLLNYIKKNNFDLIHLHNLHGYYLNYLDLVEQLKTLEIPVVWTLHDEWPITGRCAHPLECDKWKRGCGNCPDLSLYPRTYFFDFSAKRQQRKKEVFSRGWSPVIVCPSQWLADKAKESYLRGFQIKVIPNGVDPELFKPKNKIEARRKLGLTLSRKTILFVGGKPKDKQKGIKYFFKTLRHLKTKDCQILTFGEKLRPNKEMKNIGIKQFGCISKPGLIADIYNASDIFCLTSLSETFPLKVLEAMACGLPVAGFRTGGIPEQVLPDCGILTKPKKAEDLAKAIDELLADDKKRDVLGQNCRQRVLENYSLKRFQNQYINLYKEVLTFSDVRGPVSRQTRCSRGATSGIPGVAPREHLGASGNTMENYPLVSIITVVLNRKDTIAKALESVLSQTYKNIEYIVVDGGSVDGTLEVIEKYKNNIAKFKTAPDKGVFDAMNKGLRMASGNIIGFLNADDLYASNDVIEKVVRVFQEKDIDCLWGDLVYVDAKDPDKIVRYWKSSGYEKGKFQKGWMPPHPTFFARRNVYERYGFFNPRFVISADYEIMLRFLEKYKISSGYLSEVLVKMRIGGKSNKNLFNILRANLECRRSWKINGLKINPLRLFLKPLSKILQHFKKRPEKSITAK